MTEYEDESQYAEKIADILHNIHEEHGYLGSLFMGALFINGAVQTITMGAKDKESAERATEIFCNLLRSSVNFVIKSGYSFEPNETLQ
jgi:hypothetical protein